MFDFNIFDSPEPLKIYLCRPDKKIVCYLNGIEKDTAQVKVKLNGQYELSFDYSRYINNEIGELVESNGYQLLKIGMYILVEKIGFFRMQHPPYKYDGSNETKSVQAYSIDCELENKSLTNLKINTGEEDSMEYLVEYEENETESLLNAYTNLPYDYILFYDTRAEQLTDLLNNHSHPDGTVIIDAEEIKIISNMCDFIPRLKNKVIANEETKENTLIEYVVFNYDTDNTTILSISLGEYVSRIEELITFYTKYHSQLSLIDLAIEDCNWTVGEIDTDLANRKFQFSIDSKNVYSFLTQDIATVSKCVVQFDILGRKINIVSTSNLGENTGINITRKNLLKTIDVSCDENSLSTRFNVSGSDNLGISYVNFGLNKIEDLSYFMSAKDLNGNRVYVSDEIAQKYKTYCEDREKAREKYVELTKLINQSLIDIDELKYRIPNDYLSTDWSQYTLKELDGLIQTYNKYFVTLESLYKEDYGSVGLNEDGSINETFLKTTEYWNDYYAYKNIFIQLEEAVKAYDNGSNYGKIDDKDILAKIKAYETEWSLYGTVELENKIKAYENSMKVLIESEAIIVDSSVLSSIYYNYPLVWDQLNSEQQTEYGQEINYKYNEYIDIWNNHKNATDYLNVLKEELANLENNKKQNMDLRTNLVKLVDIKNYNRIELAKMVTLSGNVTDISFSNEEVETINLLYIDSDYSNENILITSLDNIVTTIDVQEELLEDAKEQLSISSQPQIKFAATIDNLLSLKEFEPLSKQFKVGNYIILQYFDDYYVKLRLVDFSFNPCIPISELGDVSFSNFVKSNVELSDVAYLLGNSSGSGVSSISSSGSSNGSSEGLGSIDKVDITLSNTMLSKLVKTEMFGTAVSNVILDTIDVNSLTAKSAKFGGLTNGTTKINGKCIETGWIVDSTYNGTNGSISNTHGSIINLETGKFNFAGGNLVWDGEKLSIGGYATNDDVDENIKNAIIENNKITVKSVDIYFATSSSESVVPTSGWDTKAPKWSEGQYIWQKTITIYSNDHEVSTNPVCISGKNSYTILLGNESHIFSGSTTSALDSSARCDIYGYKGSEKVSTTIGTISGCPTGMSVTVFNNGTINAYFTVSVNTSMTTLNGTLTIPVTIDNITFNKNFSYSLSLKGDRGESPKTLELFSDKQVVSYDKDNNLKDSSLITLTANQQNYTNEIVWSIVPSNVSLGIVSGDSKKRTLSPTVFNSINQVQIAISSGNLTDTITIVKVKDGITGETGVGISSIKEQYYKSSLITELKDGQWIDSCPVWEEGKYIWTRTVINYTNNSTKITDPICATGSDGNGVKEIVKEYYLSTKKTEQTGGSWLTACPTWKSGYYLWIREKIVYTKGDPKYTTPIVDATWEYAKDAVNWVGNYGTDQVSLLNMVKKWTNNALSDTTTINGGWIDTNTITTEKLAVGSGGNLYALGYDTFDNITINNLCYGNVENDFGYVTLSTDNVYYGKKSLKTVVTNAENRDLVTYIGHESNNYGCISVQAGKTYSISCYVKSNVKAMASLVVLGHKNIGSDYYSWTNCDDYAQTEWSRLEITYTASVDCPYISLAVCNMGAKNTIMYFDAFMIQEVDNINQKAGKFIPAGLTVIDGGNIISHSITSTQLTTDNIVSSNGRSWINLSNGTFNYGNALVWNGTTLSVNGTITSNFGKIAGFNISDTKIYGGDTTAGEKTIVMQRKTSTNIYAFACGGSSHDSYADCPFRVTHEGKLYSTNADIKGSINVTSGTISGNLNITGSIISTGSDGYHTVTLRGVQSDLNLGVFYITEKWSDGTTKYPFRVNGDGTVYADKAKLGESVYLYDAAYSTDSGGNSVGKYVEVFSVNQRNLFIDNCDVMIYKTLWVCSNITSQGKLQVDGNINTGSLSSDGNIVSYGYLYAYEGLGQASSATYDYEFNLFCKWRDGASHNILYRQSDGLGCVLGCAGITNANDVSYKTVTYIRGYTLRLYSHGGGVYLGSSGSTAVTSDENLKNIYDIDDRYVNFFNNIKPVSYIYKNKGHRTHLGFGARQIEQALTDSGLTTEEFAGVLIDKDITISAEEGRTETDIHYDDLYSLRYEEFISLNTLMIQKIYKALQKANLI